jgi:D-arabinose 1-dehydrogenase-like Zn-dependent alcohol dehydrogenase
VNLSIGPNLKEAKSVGPGTGGVSMFALLICLAAGIRPIITSSSDKKLDIARSLGQPGEISLITDPILSGISKHFILPMDEVPMLWLKM